MIHIGMLNTHYKTHYHAHAYSSDGNDNSYVDGNECCTLIVFVKKYLGSDRLKEGPQETKNCIRWCYHLLVCDDHSPE